MGVRPFCELQTLLWIAGGHWFGIDILNARKRVILFSSRSFHSDKDDANTCFYGYQWLFRTVYNKSPQSYKNCCKSLAPITLRKCGSKLQSSVTYVHCPSWRDPGVTTTWAAFPEVPGGEDLMMRSKRGLHGWR